MSDKLSGADFPAFFNAVYGHEPFPWQARLANVVCETGGWPAALDLPTGSGKTAVLDIAVFAMAIDGQRDSRERRVARRAILVVDRRTVVDQAHARAQQLAETLGRAKDGILGRVASALRDLRGQPAGVGDSSDRPPLAVSYLRGAIPRDDGWARDPSQPLVGVSTVDQVGSRLLFRGYGVTEGMRSIHAGLLGNDIVYFLDEVHLSRVFASTLDEVGRLRRAAPDAPPGALSVVTMSATHAPSEDTAAPTPFSLEPDDRAHPTLRERLEATKPVTLEAVAVAGTEAKRRTTFAERIGALALEAAAGDVRRVGVVVNRVDGALAVAAYVRAHQPADAEVTLVTGRMRAIDRASTEKIQLAAVMASAARAATDPVRFVVATQCIEAGADLDFDVLLTECASLDALVQRFGRLDRIGKFPGARGVVLVRGDQLGDTSDPIYGPALAKTWVHLEERASAGTLDFGIGGGVRDGATVDLYPPVTPARLLTPGTLDQLAKTRPAPDPDPPVAPWLHGTQPSQPEVSIVWRADRRIEDDLLSGTSVDVPDTVASLLEQCPPLRTEAVTVPLWAANAWLRGEAASVADVETDARDGEEPERNEPARARRAYRWRGGDGPMTRVDRASPGDTLVVAASTGGLLAGTFSSAATEPVLDRGDEARLGQRHRLVLRLGILAGAPRAPAEVPVDADRGWELRLQALMRAVLDAAVSDADDSDADPLVALRDHLQAGAAPVRHRWIGEVLAANPLAVLQLATAPAINSATDPLDLVVEVPGKVKVTKAQQGDELPQIASDDDRASRLGQAVNLVDHLAHVEAHALAYVDTYNVPLQLARAVVLAAAWHDAGKADPRFQRWMVDGDEVAYAALDQCLAKSGRQPSDRGKQRGARRRAGYPEGARHELMSVAMLESSDVDFGEGVDRDLVLHLVASHHGWCRPYAPIEDEGAVEHVTWEHAGHTFAASTAHGLAHAGSSVAARFARVTARYGWWGVAWLETLVRLADHSASKAEQDGRYKEARR